MSSRIIPADHVGRDQSSQKSERSLSQRPVRLQSTVNEKILELGVSLRLLSEATKNFQGELEGLLDKYKDISNAALEKLFETEFNMNELWQKVFATKWRPTRKNKRVLCENILQNCMIYLRSEYVGKPDRGNVLKTFGSLIVLDLFEFAPVVNVIVFFYVGEVTAGWILLGCIIFERMLQVIATIALESLSLSSVLASLVGVKTFLTSYYVACHGLHAKVEGSKVNLAVARMFQKGVNGIFASTPQTILNAYMIFSRLKTGGAITGTMRTQIFVVLAVCFSMGASLTNLIQEADRNFAKRGYYKSMTQILLKENGQFSAALLKEARETFYWSKQNWKDILRTEWWDNPLYESSEWNDIHLIGDKGANYAAMILKFVSGDLPWDKLVSWLNDNKDAFRDNPPTWLSKEWLTLIPKQYRDKVWDDDEYEDLCLRLELVERGFTNNRFQPLVDDEEVNDDETLEDIHQEKEKL
eukprot:g1247.t1